ncbi:tRNA pseudouridine synthase 1 [Blyttiomyces sp. JEL0837]|nr:tRNA pseudouridine synthase 1 [Blyttiomyces sp. JEL0837]
MSKEYIDALYPDHDPDADRSGTGSLYTTLKRAASRGRMGGRSRSRGRVDEEFMFAVPTSPPPYHNLHQGEASPNAENAEGSGAASSLGSLPSPPASPAMPDSPMPVPISPHGGGHVGFDGRGGMASSGTPTSPSGGSAFKRFFDTLRGREKNTRSGGHHRTESTPVPEYTETPTTPTAPTQPPNMSRSTSVPASSHTTRGRSRPRRKSNIFPPQVSVDTRFNHHDPHQKEITYEDEDDISPDLTPKFYDPIPLPPVTEESLTHLRRYRIPPETLDTLRGVLSLYRGTHSFHNYIPDAVPEDPRCFMRIVDMDLCSDPEIHFGIEWVRIRISGKGFARGQIRRMVGLAVMVVRTNTPRSLIAQSFGRVRIGIPEAPGWGVIFESPCYDDYNNSPSRSYSAKISFDMEKAVVERYRRVIIHDRVYRDEEEHMRYLDWIRSIDECAFLYSHFLNARGLVKPQTSFLRMPGVPELLVHRI